MSVDPRDPLDPIDELFASISDGREIEWEARTGGDPTRFASLREISRIAEFNRGLQKGGGAPDAPERWGHLLLLEQIGRGGQAEVFRAWDPTLRREVALKLAPPGFDGGRLLDEGRAAARIRHANVVAVHGIDRHDGRIGLWMELVRGVDLARTVSAGGPLDPIAAARLGSEIGAALSAVHAGGLLHRDVKPANVVRDAEGRYVLADFGLGLPWDERALRAAGVSGTPMSMAPELLAGAPASEKSDIYSLGELLWFALAGRHPFEAKSLEELVGAAARGPRPTLREVNPAVPAALAAIVEQAMAPEPAARTARAQDVVTALEGWSAEAVPRRSGPTSPALALTAIAVLVALAAFLTWQIGGKAPAPGDSRAPATVAVPAPAPPATYAVEATLLRRDERSSVPLSTGDRVRPGDRLSLEFRATRPAWVYVLNEDERGERYLLFPQPLFDAKNPLPADSTLRLPGTIDGRENAWTVTSAGGREHFLIVASPEAVPELEAELDRLPAPEPGRPIRYAAVGPQAIETLRGVGGVTAVPPSNEVRRAPGSAFQRFRALAGRETGVRGAWVRQVALDNPGP